MICPIKTILFAAQSHRTQRGRKKIALADTLRAKDLINVMEWFSAIMLRSDLGWANKKGKWITRV